MRRLLNVRAGSLGALLLLGCATSGPDGLMKRGAFVEAEAAYDRELAAAPGSAELERKRGAAREAVLRGKLEQARAMRMSGHGEASLSMLVEALRLEDRWALAPSPDLAALRDGEIGGAGETLGAAVRPLLAAKSPLAAGRRAEKLMPLLAHARLAPIGERIKGEVAAAGRARCAEMVAGANGQAPHLELWVVSYCALLGGDAPLKPAPEQRRGLRFTGRLANATPAQQRIVETWLADAFRETPWFAPEAAEMIPMQLAGAYDASLERRRVTLNAPYREVVRSTIDPGPFRPDLRLETEVNRVFQYEAEQYDARYSLDVTLTFELGDGEPLVVRVKLGAKKRDFEHDVSFPRADVHPRRVQLPDVSTWLTTTLNGKRPAMIKKLRSRWTKAFCARAQFSPEEAARCLEGRERRPAAVASFATVFGRDADLLLDDLARRGLDPKADKAGDKGPTAPEVEETSPLTGGETI